MTLYKNSDPRSASIGTILSFGERYRPSGSLWQSYLAYLLMSDENPYSLACERAASIDASATLSAFALSDIAEIRRVFNAPEYLADTFRPLTPSNLSESDLAVGEFVTKLAEKLRAATSDVEFLDALTDFYRQNGVGILGMCGAFYLDAHGKVVPVSHFSAVTFDDLWGYVDQKRRIIDNIDSYISGRTANNMLLYGDAGTGKSTCIKAMLNKYRSAGLRLIQIRKDQYIHIEELISSLRHRNYRFALYLDDLSFEDFEVEYKYLKAAIEGGLESTPENFLIFATSNRRHLIKETFDDREGGGDIHRNESMQEKISLSDRFGLQIRFGAPDQFDYFAIVRFLAAERGIKISDDALIDGARKFAISHSGFSGRVAEQYVRGLK